MGVTNSVCFRNTEVEMVAVISMHCCLDSSMPLYQDVIRTLEGALYTC